MDSQDSPQPGLGGATTFSLTIFSVHGHPNVILFRDSQVGVPKFLKLELPQLWRPITLCENL